MRTFKFVTTIRFLDVPREKSSDPLTLMPGLDLITKTSHRSRLVNRELETIAGIIETTHLRGASHIVACETDESIFPKPYDSGTALKVWLLWLDMLIHDSWLVKDNAMVCEVAYAQMKEGKHTEWSSNYLAYTTSLSTGQQHVDTTFSESEIVTWEALSQRLQSYLHTKNSGALDSFTKKEFSRIGRALHFIRAARRELQPAIKLTHYCTAMESIFSTENTELSHKLSERIALFLKNYDHNPTEVYDDIKSFYNIRSKVTHGDSLQSSKQGEIPNLSRKADSYLRTIINIIIKNEDLTNLFDGDKRSFESHFKDLLLGQ